MRRWISRIFLLLGITLILLAALITYRYISEEKCAGERAENTREQVQQLILEKEKMDDGSKQMRSEVYVDGNAYIGILNFPSIGISLPVMKEWDYEKLQIAPCCYSGNLYQGNLIIAGHNYRQHFQKLEKLQNDDSVIFTDVKNHSYQYEVSYTEILTPDQVNEMQEGEWDMTLFTCTSSGRKRYVVRCRRIL